ncbi:hypothetical protein G9A89_000436 [Geosiphon pyriformis]|nr:hypothetical protein G9A89_000436 [Geosiphon pyriformis]
MDHIIPLGSSIPNESTCTSFELFLNLFLSGSRWVLVTYCSRYISCRPVPTIQTLLTPPNTPLAPLNHTHTSLLVLGLAPTLGQDSYGTTIKALDRVVFRYSSYDSLGRAPPHHPPYPKTLPLCGLMALAEGAFSHPCPDGGRSAPYRGVNWGPMGPMYHHIDPPGCIIAGLGNLCSNLTWILDLRSLRFKRRLVRLVQWIAYTLLAAAAFDEGSETASLIGWCWLQSWLYIGRAIISQKSLIYAPCSTVMEKGIEYYPGSPVHPLARPIRTIACMLDTWAASR